MCPSISPELGVLLRSHTGPYSALIHSCHTSPEDVEFCLDDMVNYSRLLTGFTAALKSEPSLPAACRLCVSQGHRCAPTAGKGRSAAASEELPLLPAVLDLPGTTDEAGGKRLQGQLHPLVCVTTSIWLLSSASYPLCNVAGVGAGGWTSMSPLTRQLGDHCPPNAPKQIPPKDLCKYN